MRSRIGDDATRESALGAFVNTVATIDPAVAVRWAEVIRDEELRMAQFENIGSSWLSIDRVAARAWIEKSPLPKDVKERLLAHDGGTTNDALR